MRWVITTAGREVLEEHRDGILEWVEFVFRDREEVQNLVTGWMRSLPTRKGLVLHLVQGLQGSDDPEFWETLADQVIKAHPDRGQL
jgi:hypothetical protein